ncbi:MAG: homocysteine S-methyltransferase family protein [Chloroflexi bacterium]|nr:homocysteine S-methyltransferase family protein [Chloroflexota bacterium]
MTNPQLLDGGMGQEIVNRGGKGLYGEWASGALYEAPELVSEIHRDYIQAGADIITTNTYGTTRTRLRYIGKEDQLAPLLQIASDLANAARDQCRRDIQIAASLPPLEASYVNTFDLSFDETAAEFSEMMDLLAPGVDIYLGETLSTSFEARAFLQAAQGRSKPVWLALTLDDRQPLQLRGGEKLADVINALEAIPDALLLNCCKPATISQALPILQASGLPFGAYANGFTGIPDDWVDRGGVAQLSAREDMSPEAYARDVAGWIDAGASIVGGCCETGPAHIARLRELIDAGKGSVEASQ